jgi:DNA-directed RNA polymerase subunit beta'
VKFEDLVEGVSLRERSTRRPASSKRVVIDWRSAAARFRPAPRDRHQGREGRAGQAARGGEARYMLSVDAICRSRRARSRPATCSRVSRREAPRPATSPAVCRAWPNCSRRAPKDHAIIAEIDGTVEFGKDYKNKRRIIDEAEDETRSRSSI